MSTDIVIKRFSFNILAVDRIIMTKLKLENATLKVKELQAQKLCITTSGSSEVNSIYITGLKDQVSKDAIELCLEDMTDCEVDSITYGVNNGVAMVHFASNPGVFPSLLKHFIAGKCSK